MLKVAHICIWIICLASQLSHAQFIVENYYRDLPVGSSPEVTIDADGNRYISYLSSQSQSEIVLSKINECGEPQWTKHISSPERITRFIGLRLHNNNLILAAVIGTSFPDSSLAVLKISSAGAVIWQQSIGPSSGDVYWYNIDVNENGEIFCNANYELHSLIVKLDPSGALIWSQRYNTAPIWGKGCSTLDGGFLRAVGKSLYRLDASGSMLWRKNYMSSYQADLAPIALTDGFLIFTNPQGAHNFSQVYKIDGNGNVIWTGPALNNFEIRGAVATEDGGCILGSYGFSPVFEPELKFIQLDPQGAILNRKVFTGTNNSQFFNSMAHAENELSIVSAVDGSLGTGYSLIKLSSDNWPQGSCSLENFWINGPNSAVSNTNLAIQPKVATSIDIGAVNFVPNDAAPNRTLICQDLKLTEIPALEPDSITLCHGDSYTAEADPMPDGRYLWSTGERTTSITVDKPGVYRLEYRPQCFDTLIIDSIVVQYHPKTALKIIHDDQDIYPLSYVGSFELENGFASVPVWQLPDSSQVRGNPITFEFMDYGMQRLKVTAMDTNGCVVSDSVDLLIETPRLYLPDAFTPDGDGLNDSFGLPPGKIYGYRLEIYDRWGKLVSETVNSGWDGRIGGQAASPDTYVYIIRYQFFENQFPKLKKGSVTLIR